MDSLGKSMMLLCTLVPLLNVATALSTARGGDVAGKLSGSEEDFKSLVFPLAEMSGLAYITAGGSFHVNGSEKIEVEGWLKDEELEVNSPEGGINALVFAPEESAPVVVAFRGSDFQLKTRAGASDICFDLSVVEQDFSVICSEFTEDELDYFTQAKKVMDSTLKKYPSQGILVTGHSAGCGLAAMMAVEYESQGVTAVCFSLPGVLRYTSKKTGVAAEKILAMDNIHSITLSQDPIVAGGIIEGDLFGQVYVWRLPENEACTACCVFAHNQTRIQTLMHHDCKTCFGETHDFRVYMKQFSRDEMPVLTQIPDSIRDCSNIFSLDSDENQETDVASQDTGENQPAFIALQDMNSRLATSTEDSEEVEEEGLHPQKIGTTKLVVLTVAAGASAFVVVGLGVAAFLSGRRKRRAMRYAGLELPGFQP